jgi:uncharacterized membrane protein YdjX (TVP38/TMEM64 family)
LVDRRRSARWRLALLAALLAAAAALAFSGAWEALAPERLRETVLEAGPLGPVLFVLAFAVLEPFQVPGVLFLLTAPLIWPLPVAFVLCMAGALGASLVALLLARGLARDQVQERLPEGFRAWDRRLAEHGFRTVVLIRLATFLMPAAHWAIGLSSVGVVPATVGTAVGLAPGIALFVWLGAEVVAHVGAVPDAAWVALVVAVVAGLLWRRRRAAAAGTGPG